jgi:hypothetical protein
MSHPDGKSRPWRQIARELAVERDSTRVLELAKELNDALLTQAIDGDLVEAHATNETVRHQKTA